MSALHGSWGNLLDYGIAPEESICRHLQLHPGSMATWEWCVTAQGLLETPHFFDTVTRGRASIRWGGECVCAMAADRAESRLGYSAHPL